MDDNLFSNDASVPAVQDMQPPATKGPINLFGSGPMGAQQAAMQQIQAQALKQAELTPEQNGVYMANQAAGLFGNALAGMGGTASPAIVRAKALQEAQMETQNSGYKDPVDYFRKAADILLKKGFYNEALQAAEQADKLEKNGTGIEAQKATTAKTKVETKKAGVEADTAKDYRSAQIEEMLARAAKERTLSEKEARLGDFDLMKQLFEEAGDGTITPARKAFLNAMIDIKSKPQTVVGNVLGGAKTADSYLPQPGAAPAAGLPAGIPAGSKQIGTSGGKPVYQDAQGKKWIAK